jgi:hypothetical protein
MHINRAIKQPFDDIFTFDRGNGVLIKKGILNPIHKFYFQLFLKRLLKLYNLRAVHFLRLKYLKLFHLIIISLKNEFLVFRNESTEK